MDMNKAFFLKKQDEAPNWLVIDAKEQILGRLAAQVASILRGKNSSRFTPHSDAGDYVIIINAKDIKLTGNKWTDKLYDWYSGYIGGYKTAAARDLHKKHPTRLIELAVKRMLPKTKLGKTMFKKLRVYEGNTHPHKAQVAHSA